MSPPFANTGGDLSSSSSPTFFLSLSFPHRRSLEIDAKIATNLSRVYIVSNKQDDYADERIMRVKGDPQMNERLRHYGGEGGGRGNIKRVVMHAHAKTASPLSRQA